MDVCVLGDRLVRGGSEGSREGACWDALWGQGQVNSHSVDCVGKRVLILSILSPWSQRLWVRPCNQRCPSGTFRESQKALRASTQWSWSQLFCSWQPRREPWHRIEAAAEGQQAEPWNPGVGVGAMLSPNPQLHPDHDFSGLTPTVESFISWEAPCYLASISLRSYMLNADYKGWGQGSSCLSACGACPMSAPAPTVPRSSNCRWQCIFLSPRFAFIVPPISLPQTTLKSGFWNPSVERPWAQKPTVCASM